MLVRVLSSTCCEPRKFVKLLPFQEKLKSGNTLPCSRFVFLFGNHFSLYQKIFLIDCPGVVTPAKDETEDNIVLKGVVRVENLEDPTLYVPALLERVKKVIPELCFQFTHPMQEHIQKTYGIMEWKDATDFLESYAQKTGKLLKKGEPDVTAVSKMILNDWIRGKIPFFIPPPDDGERDEVQVPEGPTVPTKYGSACEDNLRR